MKKSISLLGAFALLIAVPSFAQEKSSTENNTIEEKSVTIEKSEEPIMETRTKQEVVLEKKLETSKSSKNRELKSAEPIREEEK